MPIIEIRHRGPGDLVTTVADIPSEQNGSYPIEGSDSHIGVVFMLDQSPAQVVLFPDHPSIISGTKDKDIRTVQLDYNGEGRHPISKYEEVVVFLGRPINPEKAARIKEGQEAYERWQQEKWPLYNSPLSDL